MTREPDTLSHSHIISHPQRVGLIHGPSLTLGARLPSPLSAPTQQPSVCVAPTSTSNHQLTPPPTQTQPAPSAPMPATIENLTAFISARLSRPSPSPHPRSSEDSLNMRARYQRSASPGTERTVAIREGSYIARRELLELHNEAATSAAAAAAVSKWDAALRLRRPRPRRRKLLSHPCQRRLRIRLEL